MFENVKFDKNGLIPAVVQDSTTGEVLMLAYMNSESLTKTLKTGTTYFYSRSRQELWNKGATSGNFQYVEEVSFDCDYDAILVKVRQKGVACHTGNNSCFHNKVESKNDCLNYSILYNLQDIIMDRRLNPKEKSYTNYLFEKGIDKILKKIGEESSEVIIAAKNTERQETIYEVADLIYHSMVLLNVKGISLDEIFKELSSRFK